MSWSRSLKSSKTTETLPLSRKSSICSPSLNYPISGQEQVAYCSTHSWRHTRISLSRRRSLTMTTRAARSLNPWALISSGVDYLSRLNKWFPFSNYHPRCNNSKHNNSSRSLRLTNNPCSPRPALVWATQITRQVCSRIPLHFRGNMRVSPAYSRSMSIWSEK